MRKKNKSLNFSEFCKAGWEGASRSPSLATCRGAPRSARGRQPAGSGAWAWPDPALGVSLFPHASGFGLVCFRWEVWCEPEILYRDRKKKKKEEGETSPAEARGLHALSPSLCFHRAPGFPVAAAAAWDGAKKWTGLSPAASQHPSIARTCKARAAWASGGNIFPKSCPRFPQRQKGGHHLPPGSGALGTPGHGGGERRGTPPEKQGLLQECCLFPLSPGYLAVWGSLYTAQYILLEWHLHPPCPAASLLAAATAVCPVLLGHRESFLFE